MTGASPYIPQRASRSRYLSVRGFRYHVREWGPSDGKPLVLLHGGKDSSVSFQFIADALGEAWHILAPDWRGHGLTQATPGAYWISDFLCDLDVLLAQLIPGGRAPLVGHSLGGNIASIFAGLRPDAVSHLILLDALGGRPAATPVNMVAMLTELMDAERSDLPRRVYKTIDEMTVRLTQAHPRLEPALASFLAAENAQPIDGGLGWPHDPNFLRSWSTLHTMEEWGACWGRVVAPVLCILASDPMPHSPTRDPGVVAARTSFFRDVTVRTAPGTGHNVHQEAPGILAQWIEAFLHGR